MKNIRLNDLEHADYEEALVALGDRTNLDFSATTDTSGKPVSVEECEERNKPFFEALVQQRKMEYIREWEGEFGYYDLLFIDDGTEKGHVIPVPVFIDIALGEDKVSGAGYDALLSQALIKFQYAFIEEGPSLSIFDRERYKKQQGRRIPSTLEGPDALAQELDSMKGKVDTLLEEDGLKTIILQVEEELGVKIRNRYLLSYLRILEEEDMTTEHLTETLRTIAQHGGIMEDSYMTEDSDDEQSSFRAFFLGEDSERHINHSYWGREIPGFEDKLPIIERLEILQFQYKWAREKEKIEQRARLMKVVEKENGARFLQEV